MDFRSVSNPLSVSVVKASHLVEVTCSRRRRIGACEASVNFKVSSEPIEITSAFQFVPNLLLCLFKLFLKQSVVIGGVRGARTRPSSKVVDRGFVHSGATCDCHPSVSGGVEGEASIGLRPQHLSAEACEPLRDRCSLP